MTDIEAAAKAAGTNRFGLVAIVRERARDIALGSPPRAAGAKPLSIALAEADAGLLRAAARTRAEKR